jgi:hypothetical protein
LISHYFSIYPLFVHTVSYFLFFRLSFSFFHFRLCLLVCSFSFFLLIRHNTSPARDKALYSNWRA